MSFRRLSSGLSVKFSHLCSLFSQKLDFTDGLAAQTQAFGRAAQAELTGERQLLIEGHIGILSASHPDYLYHPAVLGWYIAVYVDSIEVGAVIHRYLFIRIG